MSSSKGRKINALEKKLHQVALAAGKVRPSARFDCFQNTNACFVRAIASHTEGDGCAGERRLQAYRGHKLSICCSTRPKSTCRLYKVELR